MNDNLDLPFQFIKITADSPYLKDINKITLTADMIGAVLCTEGDIDVIIDSKPYSISKGSMYFYVPSFFAIVESVSPDFQSIAIITDYNFALPLINKIIDVKNQLFVRSHPCLKLTDEQYDNISMLINSLAKRIEIENTSSVDFTRKRILRELIISLGTTLSYEIVNIFFTNIPLEPSVQDRNDMVVQKFIVSLYQHFRLERSVYFYANEQAMSPSYFSTLIKEKTGRTALNWIIEMVLIDAKQMLQYSEISIKEIAMRLNFPSQSFFGKYFKQYTGISPKNYRKKMKLDNHE